MYVTIKILATFESMYKAFPRQFTVHIILVEKINHLINHQILEFNSTDMYDYVFHNC